jgi:hypothetical protein
MLPCANMIARPAVASCQKSASVNTIRSCGIPPRRRQRRSHLRGNIQRLAHFHPAGGPEGRAQCLAVNEFGGGKVVPFRFLFEPPQAFFIVPAR